MPNQDQYVTEQFTRELVEIVHHGSRDQADQAMSTLYKEFQDYCLSKAKQNNGIPERDYGEAVNHVMYNLFKSLQRRDISKEFASVKAFIFTFITRRMISYYIDKNKRKRVKMVLEGDPEYTRATNNDEHKKYTMGEDPADIVQRKYENQELHAGLDALGPRRKTMLIMQSQGSSYKEIAETLNVSISTVKNEILRGRKKMRELLE
jgi:RNA polymerase sigma factor (sigma-70 family)